MGHEPIPKGLSPASGQVWTELTERYECTLPELIAMRRALEWFDKGDALLKAANRGGGDAPRLVKLSMDAANTGLRFWRLLKFTSGTAARPGRPSDDNWSTKRRLAAAMRDARHAG